MPYLIIALVVLALGCSEPHAPPVAERDAGSRPEPSDPDLEQALRDLEEEFGPHPDCTFWGDRGCMDPIPGDADADGVPDEDDCRPHDPYVHPGRAEVLCNGRDDDCDGVEVCPRCEVHSDCPGEEAYCCLDDAYIVPRCYPRIHVGIVCLCDTDEECPPIMPSCEPLFTTAPELGGRCRVRTDAGVGP